MGSYTGLKVSELLRLRVCDVKDKQEIEIIRNKKVQIIKLHKELQSVLIEYICTLKNQSDEN
ncbi:MAG: hypothetical protein A2275_09615 [Bacteroidetes bacterium RIFOXYA12_FULL_35_11]|nr:MAG: hypothetical protein A2X01_08585 [Bacteroidetes bacterium GWF2_35_48]OFY74811.1 MAG: hypothetical protein A2275_09615 [Bacteroidetes bacterium RIFOXYA12_FULL_35_11]OFY92802.1 MAG: hypothetical protein A2309_08385 [Bacteroidetes bacterium RIFOXYB2_FULL_35_7]OFY97937.1 MAG: hypothetical protein A2491_03595 [Bacteroidetes bacterium RIFOXYC12_FULL_35_7]HBX52466.1 hypothetical protein [Bacteroidales bacterium]